MTHVLTQEDVTAIIVEKNCLVRENYGLRKENADLRIENAVLRAEKDALQLQVIGHCDHIAAQSELLSKRAEAP